MLLISVVLLMSAVALPHIRLAPLSSLRTASLALLVSGLLSISCISMSGIGSGLSLYNGLYHVSLVSLSLTSLILVVGAIALVPWAPISVPVGVSSRPTRGEYAVLALFSTCGSTLLCSSSDVVSLYLSVELQSFGVYVLSALYRDSETSTASGLQYLMLGGLSSCFILLGSGLVYASTGHTDLDAVYSLVSVGDLVGIETCALGLVLMGVGLLFKTSAAPFHQWTPDVYDGVPTIVTTWIGVLPKIGVLAVLLELSVGLIGPQSNPILTHVWGNLLLISALLSLVVGAVVGLAQDRIKRLLSYSTINHVGFILTAVVVANEQGIESFLLYVLQYSITSLLSFAILLGLGYGLWEGDVSLTKGLSGSGQNQPLIALSLTLVLISISGVPPLVGFFAKMGVLDASLNAGMVFVAVTSVVTSVVSASYYLNVIRVLHFETPISPPQVTVGDSMSTIHSFMISVLTLGLLLFPLQPELVLDSVLLITLCLHNS